MPEIPEAAIAAALAARAHALSDRPDPMVLSDETLMRLTLEGAAVELGQHVADKILGHLEAHWPPEPGRAAISRRLFGIAARVAARAFLTEDDLRRRAAEALARGDFLGCVIPQGGPDGD